MAVVGGISWVDKFMGSTMVYCGGLQCHPIS
jgi:hypothetical protein